LDSRLNTTTNLAGKLLIAGPCSAETEEQVLSTAHALAKIPGVGVFRCGLWKPRTRPGDFEGVGDRGLPWLMRVRQETGLKIAVEVAIPDHAEACLEHRVDMLWIGSRTVVNPFSMQEIAVSLNGADIPVMVKNPVNPDLMLWVGAIERLINQGVKKLSAIHRGFSLPGPGLYRNDPLWMIPMELRNIFPGLPLVSDPSHICGNKELLRSVSQTALDLGFDGLMIECHAWPDEALTDRGQQLTPRDLEMLLDSLTISSDHRAESLLRALRGEIDRLDDTLLTILASRMEVAENIGKIKKEAGIDIPDPERWKEVLADRLIKSNLAGLNIDFVKNILDEIHRESKRRQE
jgi:chorismate mutase